MNKILYSIALMSLIISCSNSRKGEVNQNQATKKISNTGKKAKTSDSLRAKEISDMKFGMFICWSFSTFYGEEWTPTLDKDASYFNATGCDTDQWCKVAKDAGMGYILFLSKHHDGFCLWSTKTTDKNTISGWHSIFQKVTGTGLGPLMGKGIITVWA